MFTIKNNETQPFDFKNRTINAIQLAFTGIHATANTAFAAAVIDWSKVSIKAILTRDGREKTICNGIVLPMVLAGDFEHGAFTQLVSGTNKVVLAAAGGVYEKAIQTVIIPLRGFINLKNDDKLLVEVTINDTAIVSTANQTSSFMEADVVDAKGIEVFTPSIYVKNFQAGTPAESVSLGDNVSAAYLVNSDKLDNLDASSVVASVNVSSDMYNQNLNLRGLQARRNHQFSNLADGYLRYNNFRLLEDVANSVKIDLNFYNGGSNVTAGKTWLVAFQNELTQSVYERAKRTMAKHADRDDNRVRNAPHA